MELDLPFGPWKEIASAEWNSVPTGIYVNPEKLLLLVAFPKESEKSKASSDVPAGKQGVLVLLKKPLFLEGNASGIEKFMQGQNRDLSLISKIVDKRHFTFVLLESQPFYVEFRKEELVRAVKEQREEIDALAKLTFDVARSYGCHAKELDKLEEGVSENLLGDPTMLFALGGFKSKKMFSELDEKKAILGFNAEGEQVEVSTGEMQTILISGQGKQPRLKAMQVCVENLLLSGIPCIVVGEGDYLQNLAFPNKNPIGLEKNGLPKASGFPLKNYSLGKGFFIDLKWISPSSFSKKFFPSDLQGLVEGAWGESSVSGLREKLESQEQKYSVAKAVRILTVAEKGFGGVFAANTVEDLKSPWSEKTGKVVFLNAGPDAQLHSLALESVLNSLGEPKEGYALAVVLETDASKLPKEVIALISSLQNKVFFVLNSENNSESIETVAPTMHIELLNANLECVASLSGEKKRLALRPTFSAN